MTITTLFPSYRWKINFRDMRLPTAVREQRQSFAIKFVPGTYILNGVLRFHRKLTGSLKPQAITFWNVNFTRLFTCRRFILNKHVLLKCVGYWVHKVSPSCLLLSFTSWWRSQMFFLEDGEQHKHSPGDWISKNLVTFVRLLLSSLSIDA